MRNVICALFSLFLLQESFAQTSEIIEDSLVIYANECIKNVTALAPSATDTVHSTSPPSAFSIYAILEAKEWILLVYDGTGVYSYSMGRKSQQIRRNPIAMDVNLCEIVAREYLEPISKDKSVKVGDYKINNYYKLNKVGRSLYKATLLFNQGKRSMGPILDSFRGIYNADFFKKPKKKVENLEKKLDQKDKDLAALQKEMDLLREQLKKQQEEDSVATPKTTPYPPLANNTPDLDTNQTQSYTEEPTQDSTQIKEDPVMMNTTTLSSDNTSPSTQQPSSLSNRNNNTNTPSAYPIIDVSEPDDTLDPDSNSTQTIPISIPPSTIDTSSSDPVYPPASTQTEFYTGKEDSLKNIRDSLNRKLEELKRVIEEKRKNAGQSPAKQQGSLMHKLQEPKIQGYTFTNPGMLIKTKPVLRNLSLPQLQNPGSTKIASCLDIGKTDRPEKLRPDGHAYSVG